MKRMLIIATLLLAACGGSEQKSNTPAADKAGAAKESRILNGAGATFPYPVYSKWFDEYSKMHPDVRINYQSIGSGGGIKQLTSKTVFFGATDAPMTDEQLKSAPGPILHFPTVLGGVVPIYNVEGVTQPLQFTGALLSDIYLGKIKKWNDPAIRKINPGVNLPATDIAVAHRSDGSGTTFVFVDYLSKVSPEWKQRVGASTSVQWPTGVGAKGYEGVSGLVRQTPGAIGYVELIYASKNDISYGLVQNKAGQFINPTLEAVTAAAAAAAANMPDDFRVSITNADGKDAYPISSFTWMLFYQNPDDKGAGRTMVEFMKWALTDGQKMASPLGYAPLPAPVVDKEIPVLGKIQL